MKNNRTQKFIGVVSLHDIKSIPKEEWSITKVKDIVRPVSDYEKVDMDAEISDIIKRMSINNLGHLVVMSGGKLKGLITKSDIMRFIKLRSELH
jgi:predicted transcriptional regulator